jgi:hypothetical protein
MIDFFFIILQTNFITTVEAAFASPSCVIPVIEHEDEEEGKRREERCVLLSL